jgi:alpha-glucosidase
MTCRTTRDVDPMFGTLGDFDALVKVAHELGLKVMIDLVLSHTSTSTPGSRKPFGPRQPQGRLVCLGRTQARWHAAQQLAVDLRRLGLGVGRQARAVLPAQFPHLAAGPELPQSGSSGRPARTWCASGLTGGSTASGSTPSISISTTRNCATTRRSPGAAQRFHRAGGQPLQLPGPCLRQEPAENLEFLKRFRALLDEYPGTTAVGEVGDAQIGLQIVADYTSGNDKMHMCYAFEFLSNTRLALIASGP